MRNDQKARRVVDGFKLPSDAAITENERAWIEFLRIICNDRVPAPGSDMVVELRRLLGGV
ncbi:hypothetical protein [Tabrizicola sp. BL-A-41-H6]|uniref:hypothetical protein n=1 Tax=Tabrizicola sp. BL-A-41-H6 TaxID=3421107 RepID=UPI003D672B84